MKKLLTFLLAICMCVPLAFVAVGCDNSGVQELKKQSQPSSNEDGGSSEQGEDKNADVLASGLYNDNGELAMSWVEIVETYPLAFETVGQIKSDESLKSSLSGHLAIDNSIHVISEGAFSGCEGLTKVTLPDKLMTVEDRAFSGCTNLSSVLFPEVVLSVGDYAFSGCSSLINVTFPNYLSSIGDSAFYNCSELKSVAFPEVLTSLGSQAFDGCTDLVSVTFPTKGLIRISQGAFSGCTSLNSVVLPEGLTTIGTDAFHGCFGLRSVEFPDSLTTIGFSAFDSCTSLTSITLSRGITLIDAHAFFGCTELVEVINKSSLTIVRGYSSNGYVGYYAHFVLSEDESEGYESTIVVADNGVKYYTNNKGDYIAYSYDGEISEILLDENCTEILEETFNHNTDLISITLPESLTTISASAFSGCTSLTSITLPESLAIISGSAFYNCTALTRVDYAGTIAQWCGICFSDDYSNPLKYAHHLYIDGEEITKITAGDLKGVTSISDNVFYGCTSLTSIILPEGLTSISDNAFYGCTGLTSITPPEGLTTISTSAFSGCTNLTSILLPESLTFIGDGAFIDCTALTRVDYAGTIAQWCDINFDSAISSYSNPLSYAHHLYIDGEEVTEITAEDLDGVTSINNSAFYGCAGLTSIALPEGLTFIGRRAFNGCTSLTSIILPEGLTSIGDGAFYRCVSLTSITLPEGLTSIGPETFGNCGLLSAVFPKSLKSIHEYAFGFNGPSYNFTAVFYAGVEADWQNIEMRLSPLYATIYYFSEEPNYDGAHWHYDADGKTPVVWEQ